MDQPWGPADTELFFVSFPKCGRTWLHVLLMKIMVDTFHLESDFAQELSIHKLTWHLKKQLPSLRISHFSHIYAEPRLQKPYSWFLDLEASVFEEFQDKDIVMLVRDPRDVIVSYYFHITKRKRPRVYHRNDIHSFIRDDIFGIRKLLGFYQSWYRFRHVPKSLTVIKYEDLYLAPKPTLRRVLAAMHFPVPNSDILDRALAWGSFENMQELEKARYYNNDAMHPRSLQDPGSFKVREGKIGGHKAHLSPEDLEYLDKTIEEMGFPVYTL